MTYSFILFSKFGPEVQATLWVVREYIKTWRVRRAIDLQPIPHTF